MSNNQIINNILQQDVQIKQQTNGVVLVCPFKVFFYARRLQNHYKASKLLREKIHTIIFFLLRRGKTNLFLMVFSPPTLSILRYFTT